MLILLFSKSPQPPPNPSKPKRYGYRQQYNLYITMADGGFDAHWDDDDGNDSFPVTSKFDDWSAADQSHQSDDPFAVKPPPEPAGGDNANTSAGQSYGFGSTVAEEEEFHDEEIGQPQQQRQAVPPPARKPSGGASSASGRRPPQQGQSQRGRGPGGPGRSQRPPSGARSQRSGRGRGRSGRGRGNSARGGRSGRGPGPGRSGRQPEAQSYRGSGGRSGGPPGANRKQGAGPPPGGRPRSSGKYDKKPSGRRGPNGEPLGPNGEPLGPDGKPLEKNQRFKDMETTGQWGEISRKEKIGAGIVVGLLVIGAVLGIVFGVVLKDTPTTTEVEELTIAPTASPTLAEDYAYNQIKAASPQITFPGDPTALIGSGENPSAPSQFKAAEFVMYDDTLQLKPGDPMFIQRYALYVFYLETNGSGWIKFDNWPSGPNTCEFHGVQCDYTREKVVKLVLNDNGLSGMIPYEIVSLEELIEIDVFGNQLQGELPYDAFLDHPKLSTLDVQSNNLSGTISALLQDAKLVNFFIKDAGLTGNVPPVLCVSMDTIFTDCAQNNCGSSLDCFDACKGPNCF